MDSETLQRTIGLEPDPGIALLRTGVEQMNQARTRTERDRVLDSLHQMTPVLGSAYQSNRDQMDRLFADLHRAGEGVKTRCKGLHSAVKRASRAIQRQAGPETPDGLETAEPAVLGRLVLTRSGSVKANTLNSSRILTLDSRWTTRIRLNEFTGSVEVDGDRVEDRHLTAIQLLSLIHI